MIHERINELINSIKSAFESISKFPGVLEELKRHNSDDEVLYDKIINGLNTIKKFENKKRSLIKKTENTELIKLQNEEMKNIKLLEILIKKLEKEELLEARLTEKRINIIKKNIPRLLIRESAMLKE